MKIEDVSYGIIPVVKGEEYKFLILHQTNGNWSFPKGHAEGSETDIEAALREFGEETGLREVELDEDNVFQEEYSYDKDGNTVHKTNYYFIGYITESPLRAQESEVQDYKYATLEEALNTFTHKEPKELLKNIFEFLSESAN